MQTQPDVAPVQRKPLKLGGQAQDEADLWNLVQPASKSAPAPGGVQSFEEALRRVDSSLEALVGPSSSAPVEPLVEPIIEADVVSSGANMTSRIDDIESNEATDSAEAARLRRQRLLRRAMENMGSMPPRESSPSGITGSPSGITNTSSPSGITSSPSSASVPSSSPSRPPSAAEQQLGVQIEARYAQLSRKDHFLTLGVAPTATREQVKSAFLNLAKTFHPDRLPPSLPHLAQKMSAVFEGIREAYETLFDDAKRAAWQAAQQGAASRAPATQSQQASDLFKMGEVFFKKRDYKQADIHFGKAHALDKSANSIAAQAWAIYMDPTRKADAPAARQMMQRAIAIDPTSDRANYQLGVIARVEGDMERAEKHFREAVRSNPRHLEANQEIRLIEMRKKKADPKKGGSGGFFG
jgi:curved DNA-binding protein CbpA